ncbi:MAG: Uma2 family endonuclease [Saprospiraceae bacterium]
MEVLPSVTKFEDLDLNKLYTYADYLTWQFKERVELIRGRIFKMSPAPTSYHQMISSKLHVDIGNFLKGKSCLIFSAPFDVRLSRKNTLNEDISTVVQPDLCVICDRSKIDIRGCLGAPDLIIEILSPANSQIEITKKFDLYELNQVKEYWIVYPYEGTVQIYILDGSGKFSTHRPLSSGDIVQSTVLEGFTIQVDSIFEGLDFKLM